MVLSFSSPECTLARVGGKGMNLSVMARAGFPVPPGFIVPTEGYRDFVAANGLQAQIVALAHAAVVDDPASLETTSQRIQALFAQGKLSVQWAAAIQHATESELASSAVAVRSSATAEDLPGLSFAGQQDTYLNVIGPPAIIDAVQRCWASLWTARAIGYRARNHISPDSVALAVVVQRMVASEVSGILFTANPLTGNRDEMVIDASFGLGEAIVSGQVEPDHYTVDAHTAQIKAKRLGAKALQIVPSANHAGGTTTHQQDNAERQALSDAQIVTLAQLAQRIAAHYGTPQDIEWAWANEQLYLLQSRPITSLYPLPKRGRERPMPLYFSFNSVQGVTDPITPLGQDALRAVLGGMTQYIGLRRSREQLLLSAGERLFIDLTDAVYVPRTRHAMLQVLSASDPGAREIIRHMDAAGRFADNASINNTGAMLRVMRTLARRLLPGAMKAMHQPEQAAAPALAACEALLSEAQHNAQSAKDLGALLAVMDADLSRSLRTLAKQLLVLIAPSMFALRFLDTRLSRWIGTAPNATLALTRGLPNNVTTEMNLKLWQVAQTMRHDMRKDANALAMFLREPIEVLVRHYQAQQLPPLAQQAIAGFLADYGARGLVEIDLGRSRWADDPTPIFDTLRSYLLLEDANAAPDALFARSAQEAERTAQEFIARVREIRTTLPFVAGLRAKVVAAVMQRLRLLAGLRESPKFYLIRILDAYRRRLLDFGQSMVKDGVLNRADDIFFVSIDALRSFAQGQTIDLRAMANERRANYDFEKQRRRMPRIILGNGETFYEGMTASATDASDDVLVGQAVSPGVVEGNVRVVLDPRNAQLQPGEILVCPATDPGWTPLFMTAAGLVMEIGGMVTHGSVVAREYGIPAVVGVHEATTRLKTGDRVRLDGAAGKVIIKVRMKKAE